MSQHKYKVGDKVIYLADDTLCEVIEVVNGNHEKGPRIYIRFSDTGHELSYYEYQLRPLTPLEKLL